MLTLFLNLNSAETQIQCCPVIDNQPSPMASGQSPLIIIFLDLRRSLGRPTASLASYHRLVTHLSPISWASFSLAYSCSLISASYALCFSSKAILCLSIIKLRRHLQSLFIAYTTSVPYIEYINTLHPIFPVWFHCSGEAAGFDTYLFTNYGLAWSTAGWSISINALSQSKAWFMC